MSIVIQNMGQEGNNVWRYEVRINREVIARYSHYRPDGLEVCLRKAADAVADARTPAPRPGSRKGTPEGS